MTMPRFIRYRYHGIVRYGALEGTDIGPLAGEFAQFKPANLPDVRMQDVELLAPATPSKIIAVGSNFRNVSEGENSISSDEIKFWTKAPNVLNDPDGTVELPSYLPSVKVYHEVELAVVIGKRAKRV